MSRVVVLGAAGSLGSHVVQQAVAAGHAVSVVVRTPSKLRDATRGKVVVHRCDLQAATAGDLAALFRGHDAVVNTAGRVTDGQRFVDLVDRVVTGLEALGSEDRPACWFMAGLGLLDIDAAGRRGVDLPRLRSTYWPHRANFERIARTALDGRILCPGPWSSDRRSASRRCAARSTACRCPCRRSVDRCRASCGCPCSAGSSRK